MSEQEAQSESNSLTRTQHLKSIRDLQNPRESGEIRFQQRDTVIGSGRFAIRYASNLRQAGGSL